MFIKKKNSNNMLSSDNVEIVGKIEPEAWFRKEWKASCRSAYNGYDAVRDLASKAKNAGLSRWEVFKFVKKNCSEYSKEKVIWAAIYKGYGK